MMLNRSIQRDLDHFFQKLSSNNYSIREATKEAFTQARAKLNPWAFSRLNELAADQNREHNQQINKTNSIAKTRDILVGVFLKHDYQNALFSFDDIVYRTRELIRLGRKKPRKHRQKRPYPMNNKRL